MAAVAFSTLMVSCNNAEVLPDDYYCEDEIINLERDVTIDCVTRSGEAAMVSGKVSVSYNTNSEKVESYYVSPELLEITGITQHELDNIIEEQIEIENTISAAPVQVNMKDYDMTTHAGCIEFCKDKYTNPDGTKIPGRGKCKGNCWIDTAIRIIDALPL